MQKGQSHLLSAICMLACSYSRESPLSSPSCALVQEEYNFPASELRVPLLPQGQLSSQTLIMCFGYLLCLATKRGLSGNWHIYAIMAEGVDRGGQRTSAI